MQYLQQRTYQFTFQKGVATSQMNAVVSKTGYRGEIPPLPPQETCPAVKLTVTLGIHTCTCT